MACNRTHRLPLQDCLFVAQNLLDGLLLLGTLPRGQEGEHVCTLTRPGLGLAALADQIHVEDEEHMIPILVLQFHQLDTSNGCYAGSRSWPIDYSRSTIVDYLGEEVEGIDGCRYHQEHRLLHLQKGHHDLVEHRQGHVGGLLRDHNGCTYTTQSLQKKRKR